MDLSIIIVSWNVESLLERCLISLVQGLRGIPGAAELNYEVILVDNASTDGTVRMLETAYPWVRRVQNQQNVGFARATNQALALSRGRCFLLLNPDTEVLGPSLQAMVRYMDAHSKVGASGPQLRNPDGTIQPSRRRFPTYYTGFIESTPLQAWWPDHRLLRDYYMRDVDAGRRQQVDWLVGACVMLRRDAYEEIGPLDERYFMYSEELDYAYRLRQAGWRLMYLPEARVVHHEGGSSEQVAAKRLILFHTAKVQFYTKVFGKRRGELLRLFLLTTFVCQWLAEAAKWLLGHKRPLRRQRMLAYRQVLRSRLVPARLTVPARSEA